MTASPHLSGQHDATGDGAGRPRCAVCDHQVSEHDPIGLRYCRATQARALPRTCICRVQ